MHNVMKRAWALEERLRSWRRYLHQYPELSFRETKTAAYVAEVLEGLGLDARRGVGRTGVVAEIGRGEPIVALRADMDALPIQEENEVPYASKTPGVMHACGHDAHTAALLGAATLLFDRAPAKGRVRLLFQPSEEAADSDGMSGAMRMIEDGAMAGVEAVFGLHVDSALPAGSVATRAGPFNAAVDPFYGTVQGMSAHGARPDEGIDPVAIAGQVLSTLYAIPSRRINPLDASVVSVGVIQGGTATNVIPDQVRIQGTIRSFSPSVRQQLHREVRRAFSLAEVFGGGYSLEIQEGYPVLVNDPEKAALMRGVAEELLGEQHVTEAPRRTGAEDFSLLIQAAGQGGAFGRLGAAIEGDPRIQHHPRFDIDERCLPVGAAVLAGLAYRYLE
jgi:IAA-amino acid hydrolase